jgi:membrane protein implicated in regulation of membrane protease activity
MNPLSLIWIGAAVVFIIIEAMTFGLTTIWFAIGAVGAWIAQSLGFNPLGQIAVFLVTSSIMLFLTRPIALKYLSVGKTRTNADKLVGEVGKVIETIDNLNAKGQVKISGQIWTSRSLDNKIIPVDALIKVDKIDGVKLIVIETEDNK